MLESGQVDVLVADTSLTMERDIKEVRKIVLID